MTSLKPAGLCTVTVGRPCSQSMASVRHGTLHMSVCLFRRRSLRVRSEENERWQSQSYSLAHEPAWLVVWEPCGAQWRSASTGSGSRSAVRSAPATAGKSQRAWRTLVTGREWGPGFGPRLPEPPSSSAPSPQELPPTLLLMSSVLDDVSITPAPPFLPPCPALFV